MRRSSFSRFAFLSNYTKQNKFRQKSVGEEISEVSLTLFYRISGAWLYKGLNDSHRQPNSNLAQLAEH